MKPFYIGLLAPDAENDCVRIHVSRENLWREISPGRGFKRSGPPNFEYPAVFALVLVVPKTLFVDAEHVRNDYHLSCCA